MKAYKGTNNNKCLTLTYEVGKTYTFEGELKMCSQGFHFCKEMKDVFGYYGYNNNNFVMLEIEVLGKTIDDEYDKSVTNKLKVLRVVPSEEYEDLVKDSESLYEYDEFGNEVHFKDSSGYEEWKEYDKSGNVIHYKDSNGFEYRIIIS